MGTVKELFSPAGDLVWKNKNSLWGKPKGQLENANLTPEVECSLGFQGQYFDKETELHYNFHRYYDAEMGQYISPDPIGLLGGLHPQAYVHNPMGWVDPFGLEEFYRGTKGNDTPDFTPKPNEYKIDKTTGLVKNTHGVSVFNNTDSVTKNGFIPNKVDMSTVSDKLQIKQRGKDLKHFEIMPKENMPLGDYKTELAKVKCHG